MVMIAMVMMLVVRALHEASTCGDHPGWSSKT